MKSRCTGEQLSGGLDSGHADGKSLPCSNLWLRGCLRPPFCPAQPTTSAFRTQAPVLPTQGGTQSHLPPHITTSRQSSPVLPALAPLTRTRHLSLLVNQSRPVAAAGSNHVALVGAARRRLGRPSGLSLVLVGSRRGSRPHPRPPATILLFQALETR